ncbi:MAG: Ldh family oxidoreductase [Chloroflexota bacterium]
MVQTTTMQAEHLHAIARQFFMAVNTPYNIADTVAEILVNANLAGHDSHGILRVPSYLEQIRAGTLKPASELAILEESNARLLVDSQAGFGHYASRQAMDKAITKARAENVCCVTFKPIHHIGRLGEYAEQAARAGCIGMITVGGGSKAGGTVLPFGAAKGALGTNPIAIGIPTGDDTPFVLDFATSVVARGKILVADSKDTALPPGAIVDSAGQPSVIPADFFEGGHMLTMGNHKGYALSLLVSLLGGLGGNFVPEDAAMAGAFMQVFNVEAFMPLDQYQQNVRAFLDGMKGLPPAADVEEVLVPGDFEYRRRSQNLEHGIEVPAPIMEELAESAAQLGLSLDEQIIKPEDRMRYVPPN